jgi:hypothetical protein
MSFKKLVLVMLLGILLLPMAAGLMVNTANNSLFYLTSPAYADGYYYWNSWNYQNRWWKYSRDRRNYYYDNEYRDNDFDDQMYFQSGPRRHRWRSY